MAHAEDGKDFGSISPEDMAESEKNARFDWEDDDRNLMHDDKRVNGSYSKLLLSFRSWDQVPLFMLYEEQYECGTLYYANVLMSSRPEMLFNWRIWRRMFGDLAKYWRAKQFIVYPYKPWSPWLWRVAPSLYQRIYRLATWELNRQEVKHAKHGTRLRSIRNCLENLHWNRFQ